MADVKLFKLVSGEEVVASLIEIDQNGNHIFKNARLIAAVPHGPQHYGIEMIPFLRGAPDVTVPIASATIMMMIDSPTDLARAYLQQTSGIDLSSSIQTLHG